MLTKMVTSPDFLLLLVQRAVGASETVRWLPQLNFETHLWDLRAHVPFSVESLRYCLLFELLVMLIIMIR